MLDESIHATQQWPLLLLKLFVYLAFVLAIARGWFVLSYQKPHSGASLMQQFNKPIHGVFIAQVVLYVICFVHFVAENEFEHALTFKLHEFLNDLIKILFCADVMRLLEDFNEKQRNVLAIFGVALVATTMFDIFTHNTFKVIYFYELAFYLYSFSLVHKTRGLTLLKINWSRAELVNLVKFNLIYGYEIILVLIILIIAIDEALFYMGLTTFLLFELKFFKYLVILLQYYTYAVPIEQTIANPEFSA